MEFFVSGYCRALDGPRTVMADTEDREADCAWPECIHCLQCPVAEQIREKMEAEAS